jgi:hypothetical protein
MRPLRLPPTPIDDVRTFVNPWRLNGASTTCRVRIYGAVAVVTELATNAGVSITNAAERIFSALELEYGRLIHVEHYGPESYGGGRREDTFDLVTLTRNGRAQWKRISDDVLLGIIGTGVSAEMGCGNQG